MNYKYDQFLFRKNQSNRVELIQFVGYRPDFDSIIYSCYDLNKCNIYQCKPKDIIEANYENIYEFYEKEINTKKFIIKTMTIIFKKCKKDYKELLFQIKTINKRIKFTNKDIFSYKIIRTVTDDNKYDSKIRFLINDKYRLKDIKKDIHKKKNIALIDYKNYIRKIKKIKEEIGELKKERKIVLDSGNYVRGE